MPQIPHLQDGPNTILLCRVMATMVRWRWEDTEESGPCLPANGTYTCKTPGETELL